MLRLISRISEAPPYEAVLYVWESDIRDQHIVYNERSLNITQRLSRVMHRLRGSSEAQT